MIFVLFLIDLLAFGGFIWLLVMYLQSQYSDGKTVKNIIPYMFASLIIFCIGIFGVRIFSYIDNTSSNDTKTAEVKKATPKKKHVKKKVNPNIVKIKATDSSNVTYNKDDLISSPNMDNVFTFNVITASPVNLNYKIDDNSEAKVLSFQMVNSNEYAVSVKMLKDSEDDNGTDINLYYTNNGYKGNTDFQLTNYNSYANINDKPTTNQIKKFKKWVESQGGIFYGDDLTDDSSDYLQSASYNVDTNAINITIDLNDEVDDVKSAIEASKSEMKSAVAEIRTKAKSYYIDFNSLTINYNSEDTHVLVASKPKKSSLIFYNKAISDDIHD